MKRKITNLGDQERELRPWVNTLTEFQSEEDRAKGTPPAKVYINGSPAVEVAFVEDVETFGGNFEVVVTKVRLPESAAVLAVRGQGGLYLLHGVTETTYMNRAKTELVSVWSAEGISEVGALIDLD